MVNLTRYKFSVFAFRSRHVVGRLIEDTNGEYVKFDDVVAQNSTSDNTSMDAIALCKEVIRLAGGSTILSYSESAKIINGARAVIAQQHHR